MALPVPLGQSGPCSTGCHAVDVVLQSRTPKHGIGRHHPKTAAGHGRIAFLLLAIAKNGGITRAYMATILSSKPVKRRSCLGINTGSKLPSRSRGTSMRIGPSLVSTVLAPLQLRWLVTEAGLAAPAG